MGFVKLLFVFATVSSQLKTAYVQKSFNYFDEAVLYTTVCYVYLVENSALRDCLQFLVDIQNTTTFTVSQIGSDVSDNFTRFMNGSVKLQRATIPCNDWTAICSPVHAMMYKRMGLSVNSNKFVFPIYGDEKFSDDIRDYYQLKSFNESVWKKECEKNGHKELRDLYIAKACFTLDNYLFQIVCIFQDEFTSSLIVSCVCLFFYGRIIRSIFSNRKIPVVVSTKTFNRRSYYQSIWAYKNAKLF